MRSIESDSKEALLAMYNKLVKPVNRVLIIGDLHAPFILKGYLEFCIKTYEEYGCNRVVFIGDILDNHYSSYHETDPDGLSGGQELEMARKVIRKWYKAFPNAEVTLGNHDILVMRKAQSSDVPSEWIKNYAEVLGTPGWRYIEDIEIDGVLYCHGIGSKAHIKARKNMQSTVQGHHHTDAYVQWFVGNKFKIFGMQVGCGIDRTAYAMAYAKHYPKQAIGCGVVEDGTIAVNVMMEL